MSGGRGREEALEAIRAFGRRKGRAPSYEEIRRLLGYRSKNSAFALVRGLIGRGLLAKDDRGRLLLGSSPVRLLGSVQAGFPSPAEEELAELMDLSSYLIERPERTFLVRVTGESMSGAGIRPGDLVLVERSRAPRDRDIVIAQVDGEWTMKTYEKSPDGSVRLVAAHPDYPPITPRSELVVGGVVVGVVRKYR